MALIPDGTRDGARMRGTALQNGFFIALLVLTTAAFLGLISDFLMPVFWAAVLAVVFRRLYRTWLEKLHGRSSLAAIVTILIVVTLVILPLLFLGVMVSRETTELYQRFADGEFSLEKQLQSFRQSAPGMSAYLNALGIDREETRQGIVKAGEAARQFLTSNALSMGQGVVRFTILLVLMLYLLFFFLRDGDRLINRILRALPLSPAREQKLLEKFAEVSRATIKGTSVTGAVQGTIGGLLFWALGIPAPILWGALMAFLSFMPAVGTAMVWGPAAVILILSGETAKGIILLVAGSLLIGLVDNVLWPFLVGRDTRMPDFFVLLATLGGLAIFGVSGFVIGPLLAAFFVTFWGMFEREFRGEPGLEIAVESKQPVLAGK